MTDRFDAGMKVRREVLGDAHVDRAEAAKSSFDVPFQTMITEGAWGTLWADDTITRRERSMLTLALLAATGNFKKFQCMSAPAKILGRLKMISCRRSCMSRSMLVCPTRTTPSSLQKEHSPN